jgi:hypothetical protein
MVGVPVLLALTLAAPGGRVVAASAATGHDARYFRSGMNIRIMSRKLRRS